MSTPNVIEGEQVARPKGPPRKKINMSLAVQTIHTIKVIAEKLGIPQSHVVDKAIKRLIGKEEER